tara:strand:- start:9 stop:608 length:600 start_codon:yes stop_codon:yes gene_type:complete
MVICIEGYEEVNGICVPISRTRTTSSRNGNGLLDDIVPQIFNVKRGWDPFRDCKSIEALGFELGLSNKNSRTECKKGDTTVEYIGRSFGDWTNYGSKYGNHHLYPYGTNTVTGKKYTRDEAVDYYKDDIFGTCPEVLKNSNLKQSHTLPSSNTIKNELKGRKLLCWCSGMDREHYVGEEGRGKNDRCHGDILSSIANSP